VGARFRLGGMTQKAAGKGCIDALKEQFPK
jgi:hypothetical protein